MSEHRSGTESAQILGPDGRPWDGVPWPGPSYGPAWDEMIAYGMDPTLLEYTLSLTPAQRGQRWLDMVAFLTELRSGAASKDLGEPVPDPQECAPGPK